MQTSVRGTPEEIIGICERSEETLGQRSKKTRDSIHGKAAQGVFRQTWKARRTTRKAKASHGVGTRFPPLSRATPTGGYIVAVAVLSSVFVTPTMLCPLHRAGLPASRARLLGCFFPYAFRFFVIANAFPSRCRRASTVRPFRLRETANSPCRGFGFPLSVASPAGLFLSACDIVEKGFPEREGYRCCKVTPFFLFFHHRSPLFCTPKTNFF